jgi:hypothetical protein
LTVIFCSAVRAQQGAFEPVNVRQFASCAGNDAIDDSVGIQAAIDFVQARGSGAVVATAGTDCRIKRPIILKNGIALVGPASADPAAGIGFRIKAAADMASMITQNNKILHSARIENVILDGSVGTYKVDNIVDLSPINSYFINNQIIDGAGNCFYWRQNSVAAWINYIQGGAIANCRGWGLVAEGTDSSIIGVYFSTNALGNILQSGTGGNRYIGNQIEKAGWNGSSGTAVGIEIRTPGPQCVFPITAITLVGNYFSVNGSDVKVARGDCGTATTPVLFDVTSTGNIYNSTANLNWDIDSYIQGGIIDDNFSGSTPKIAHIRFGGTQNTKWRIGGTYALGASARIINLPSDAQVLTGGAEQLVKLGPANISSAGLDVGGTIAGGTPLAAGAILTLRSSSGTCTFTPAPSGAKGWACSSGAELKESIRDTKLSGLDWVSSLRIRDYKINSDNVEYTGVIAHELQKTHPDMVHPGPDRILAVDTPNVWKLIKAIQELKAQNDDLRACLGVWRCRLFGWK